MEAETPSREEGAEARELFIRLGINDLPASGVPLAADVRSASDKASSLGVPDWIDPKNWKEWTERLAYLAEKLTSYETNEKIMGSGRNSYYKSDLDATAMTLKEDYYSGLGSNMRAAYSIQIMMASGMVASFLVSQDRSDYKPFIPVMMRYFDVCECFPKAVCADAAYGGLKNYRFLAENGIKAYVKWTTWEKEIGGQRPALYTLEDDGSITCLGGKTGHTCGYDHGRPRKKGGIMYLIGGCGDCPWAPYCKYMAFVERKPMPDSKVFEVNPELTGYRQKAKELLLSVDGIRLRVNRSIQAEGFFGIVKHDLGWDRLTRCGMENVELEVMLVSLGRNARVIMDSVDGNGNIRTFTEWTPSEGTEAEKPKKPSWKRICRSMEIKRRKKDERDARGEKEYRYYDPEKKKRIKGH